MISSTSTTSTSGVILISDCRLEPASLLLNCMMLLSFCAITFGDQPHPAQTCLLDRDHDLANLAEIQLCITPDHDLGVRLCAHRSAASFVEFKPLELWHFEQAVHKLGRSPIHFDMESLKFARDVVEGDDGRNCDEDTEGR